MTPNRNSDTPTSEASKQAVTKHVLEDVIKSLGWEYRIDRGGLTLVSSMTGLYSDLRFAANIDPEDSKLVVIVELPVEVDDEHRSEILELINMINEDLPMASLELTGDGHVRCRNATMLYGSMPREAMKIFLFCTIGPGDEAVPILRDVLDNGMSAEEALCIHRIRLAQMYPDDSQN